VHQYELADELPVADAVELSLTQGTHLTDDRHAEADLADPGRSTDEERERGREPWAGGAEPVAATDRDSKQCGGAEEEDRELGEQSDAAGDPEGDPVSERVLPPIVHADANECVERQGPPELVENHRLKEAAGAKVERSGRYGGHREYLRETPPAQTPRE
jgi:hypothetical protein